MSLADHIDALLPQTQCRQCGYAGCRPYAEAIATGAAPINRCPPGGAAGIAGLAALLGRPVVALDPAHGTEGPRTAALIDEARCIGCTLCIQACPTDAIVGAAKQMHTAITAQCTGCSLCLPPCPVDCIEILPLAELARRGVQIPHEEISTPVAARAAQWRSHFQRRQRRMARGCAEHTGATPAAAQGERAETPLPDEDHTPERRRAAVHAALRRARARAGSTT